MIDARHETFITLCRVGSYTKTAQQLFITQPAVSQHIKYLEAEYAGKLFLYKGKSLSLTSKGETLYNYLLTVQADIAHLKSMLLANKESQSELCFGATLSIGEFVCPKILATLLQEDKLLKVSLKVENTESLLIKLRGGKISFALIEGFFDKSKYEHRLLSREPFIAVCAKEHPFAHKTVDINELLNDNLIIREEGSGTRGILENMLNSQNITLNSFCKVCEISNINAIKTLVQKNLGISFLYRACVEKELASDTIAQIDIKELEALHDFNFVFLKNSYHKQEYLTWLKRLKRLSLAIN